MPRHLLAANTLTSMKVTNTAGEDLGKIEALMMDVDRGQIAYAVLSFGGFLGFGNKLFAVPWSALHLDTDQQRLVFPITREKLEHAPGFDQDQWPSEADPYWDVHVYYGVKPHWEKD